MCSIVASRIGLRVQHRGQPRIGPYTRSTCGVKCEACGVRRKVLLLLAGIKSDEKRRYRRAIRRAETIWERHLEQLEEHDGEAVSPTDRGDAR